MSPQELFSWAVATLAWVTVFAALCGAVVAFLWARWHWRMH